MLQVPSSLPPCVPWPAAVAATMVTNAQATTKGAIMLLTNFIFISFISLLSNFSLLFWPSLASHRGKPFRAVHRGTPQDLPVRYAERCGRSIFGAHAVAPNSRIVRRRSYLRLK